MTHDTRNGLEIAIVGMSCRFPSGNDVDEFWENLKNGVESVSFFTDEELQRAGVDQESIQSPNYVKAGGAIDRTEWFDLHLFDYSPREAELMDPQVKVLHECAWEALEHSGYCSDEINELVGVYIGGSTNLVWMSTVYTQANDFMREAELLNSSQFFSTRLSHKLNLKGPSYTVQTACSSSLVAVHLACQALLSGDCDMALAGGVSITLPEKRGYFYQEGMILSRDGHCRPFDADASGTVNGNGAGIVVLKRLEDAVADGDMIYAVVKGSAINNDGSVKVGYTAPSVEGQARAIKAAQSMAEVKPESITYVEAHGTGTILGDPIEVEALKLAFNTSKQEFCNLGSVKANMGHLDNAAGVAGLMKTALSLSHRMIPPSINFRNPNEKIEFKNSPFVVNTKCKEWKNSHPLRAGVSSFGIGGTNAHAVLEEAPDRGVSDPGRKNQLLFLSAQTKNSLEELTKRFGDYLEQNTDANLADVAYTLLVGRKKLKYRKMLIASSVEEAKRKLSSLHPAKVQTVLHDSSSRPIFFLFPGQGSQYVNMGVELYQEEKTFRDEVNHCCNLLQKIRGYDLREVLYPVGQAKDDINQTIHAQPAIFIFEYALAKMLMNWGIHPDGMIGHSIGEYVAACLSGVLSLEHALKLVSARAELMQQLPRGVMVSVMASESRLLPLLSSGLSIAAVNGPSLCVVSGLVEDMNDLETQLDQEGIRYKRLHTSHAFHSSMMDPILSDFAEKVKEIDLHNPKTPYISNVTGTWMNAEDVTDPGYWASHLRNTVRFSDGISQLLSDTDSFFIEIGPGRTLSTLVRQHLTEETTNVIVNTIRPIQEQVSDEAYLLRNIGKLQLHGVNIDWPAYFSGERRFRIPLPLYPFDRQYFSIFSRSYELETGVKDHWSEKDPVLSKYKEEENHVLTQSDVEQKIIAAFREVTGVKKISPHDHFFDLGGNSLTAVNVVARLQKDLTISIIQLLEYPTAFELAQHVTYKDEKNRVNKEVLQQYLLESRERYHLSEEIRQEFTEIRRSYDERNRRYDEINLAHKSEYRDILLTGSTGYLGIYLLCELLTHSESNIHLIIRGKDQVEAEHRLKEKIRYYFGPTFYEEYKQRILVYSGDLTQNHLGLELPLFQELSESIECVMHSAANVSHFGKYDESYKANILATSNLIEFSLTGRVKDFNHISTLAVASGMVKDKQNLLYTEYDHDLGQAIDNPYPKTKLEAEKLLIEARKQGMNVNIFRIGNIGFDSRSGRFQENIEQNAIYSMLKSYIKIGFIPEMERDTDFSCVDDVSRAIIHLFDQSELKNETYHIFNPYYVSLSELLTTAGVELGVKVTSVEQFLDYVFDEQQMQHHVADIYNIQLHSIGDELPSPDELLKQTIFHISAEKTNMLLEKSGFVWSEMNEQQVMKMVEHCREVSYF